MGKTRLTVNERAELVRRDGTVVGRITSVTLELDESSWGTKGAVVEVENCKSPDGGVGEDSASAPDGHLFPVDGQATDEPDEVQRVWQHFLQATGTRQRLDKTRRGIIRNALGLRTVEQCREAIDGLVGDPWWRENRPRLELRYALRGNHANGESDEDRIDKMREKANKAKSSDGRLTVDDLLQGVPSDRQWIIRDRMSRVIQAGNRGQRDETTEEQLRTTPGIEPTFEDGKFQGWRKVS